MTIIAPSLAANPLSVFRFCPHCGAEAPSFHGERAILCRTCGFKFYWNCASAVAAFLFYRGKLILCERGMEPQKGMLDLPGGFVEFGESAEQALLREIREELNVEVVNPSYLTSAPNDYLYADVLYKITDLYYICEIDDISAIKPQDDVANYLLLSPNEVDPERLAFPSGRIALAQLLAFCSKN